MIRQDMAEPVKFSTKIDEGVLDELREYAKQSDQSISRIVSEAVAQYLARARVRPAFREAAADVIDRNAELLARLAK